MVAFPIEIRPKQLCLVCRFLQSNGGVFGFANRCKVCKNLEIGEIMLWRRLLVAARCSYRSIDLYPYAQKGAFLAILCRGCGPVCALPASGHWRPLATFQLVSDDHFADVGKMVGLGSGSEREVDNVMLTRYACYLVAQNGDPKRTQILQIWGACFTTVLQSHRYLLQSLSMPLSGSAVPVHHNVRALRYPGNAF